MAAEIRGESKVRDEGWRCECRTPLDACTEFRIQVGQRREEEESIVILSRSFIVARRVYGDFFSWSAKLCDLYRLHSLSEAAGAEDGLGGNTAGLRISTRSPSLRVAERVLSPSIPLLS